MTSLICADKEEDAEYKLRSHVEEGIQKVFSCSKGAKRQSIKGTKGRK